MGHDIYNTSGQDGNNEGNFFKKLNPREDITHILAQQAKEDGLLHETTTEKNTELSLPIVHRNIIIHMADIETYLDYIRLVVGDESYEPERTSIVNKSYPLRKKEHDEITQRMGIQNISTTDTIVLPHLVNILRKQEKIVREIKQELPKIKNLIKTDMLEFAEDQKVFNDLQQTAEYIALKGILIASFAQTDKNILDIHDRELFEELKTYVSTDETEGIKIQEAITTFLGEWMAIEYSTTKIYDNYKILRKQANLYDQKVEKYYQLMIKYDKQ